MRCRKVRSYLSAYCSDELSGRKKLAVDGHLSSCVDCRKEEAIYYSLSSAKDELGSLSVSDGFNTTLLNRIAQERFAETRTKAHLPQKAPLFTWSKVLPVAVSACMVVLVAVTMMSGLQKDSMTPFANIDSSLDDSYMTVQPTQNPNMTVKMHKDWSLHNQLARAERINNISNHLTRVGSFTSGNQATLTNVRSQQRVSIPFIPSYYHVRQVVRVYIIPNNPVKEDSGEY